MAPAVRRLRRVPGEGDGRAVALVAVVGALVEAGAELVAVLGARREAAEAGDGVAGRAHLRERAGVDGGVVAVAAGRRGGAGVHAAVGDGDVELGGERVRRVAVHGGAAGERERAGERAGVGDVHGA